MGGNRLEVQATAPLLDEVLLELELVLELARPLELELELELARPLDELELELDELELELVPVPLQPENTPSNSRKKENLSKPR